MILIHNAVNYCSRVLGQFIELLLIISQFGAISGETRAKNPKTQTGKIVYYTIIAYSYEFSHGHELNPNREWTRKLVGQFELLGSSQEWWISSTSVPASSVQPCGVFSCAFGTGQCTCVVAPRLACRTSILIEPSDRSCMWQAYRCDASLSGTVMVYFASGPDNH